MSVLVVGSGASAVQFARAALDRGVAVTMVDVGREATAPPRPEDGFEDLKRNLPDPIAHFLGEDFESVTYPGAAGEYYGFPPSKLFLFEGIDGWEMRTTGIAPLVSFAQGGLAEAWTGGVFPFDDGDLAAFPFGWEELSGPYGRVAERIGVCGERDDLTAHLPWHDGLAAPLPLDEHSRLLLERYAARRTDFARMGCVLGRSRIAVLSEDRGDRRACDRLGRCLVGCPIGSIWTPSMGLAELRGRDGFTYRPGLRVTRLLVDGHRTVRGVVAARVDGSGEERMDAERVALGAGALGSTKIFLETWRALTGESPRLTGLMDNRQVLLPFLNPSMIGRAHDPRTYQYHQLTFAMTAPDPVDYVHGLVTTLKTASIHPIVQNLPFDFRTSLHVFRNVHAALGLVNVNFPDHRRAGCWVALEPGGDEAAERPLRVHYEPPAGEAGRIRATLGRFRRALGKLGCFVPPGMSHVRPMGSSVHYSGTLPMSREERPFTTDGNGGSRDLKNLWFIDGATFPFLPAKNLTFTLMANAVRIAERAF